MATLKAIIRLDKKNKRNEYPVGVRIHHGGKKAIVPADFTIKKKHWDKTPGLVRPSHPNYLLANKILRDL